MAGAIWKKLGIREGMRAIFLDAPTEALQAIDPPHLDRTAELTGSFDYIHFFVRRQDGFADIFPKLGTHLKPSGMLWVSWPKKRQLGTDLTLPIIIKLGYNFGLVESKTISIDATWSAIKFSHPREGKVYNNSYGSLRP